MAEYTVRFHPRLSRQLEEHAAFIANVSKTAALRFLSEFEAVTKQLADNPYLYPLYDDPNLPPDTYRKALFGKWYKVVFCIEDHTVYVDAVVDGRTMN